MIKIIIDSPADGGNEWKCKNCEHAHIAGGDGLDVVHCPFFGPLKTKITRCSSFRDKRVECSIWTLPLATIQPALLLETDDDGNYVWQTWHKWRKDN